MWTNSAYLSLNILCFTLFTATSVENEYLNLSEMIDPAMLYCFSSATDYEYISILPSNILSIENDFENTTIYPIFTDLNLENKVKKCISQYTQVRVSYGKCRFVFWKPII